MMNYQKVYMNQIYSSSMMGYLSQMWRNQLLCDAVIKTGNVITKAHRIVLIAACPMLQNMENASLGSHLEVRMASDIKQDSVNAFLQYIYEGYMMLTEDNCRDIEKMAKLLQVESVVKCCTDFYKCLSVKTGVAMGGPNFNYQDNPDFKHFRITQIQKLVQDGAMKRSLDGSRPFSPSGKRPRTFYSDSPATDSDPFSKDDRSSIYQPGSQDPFDRIPRLGSGVSHSAGDVQIIEDSLEVVHKEPAERDQEGWPKETRLPPVHRTQTISVSSQMSKETNVQIVNVEREKFRPQHSSQSSVREPPRHPVAPDPTLQSFGQGPRFSPVKHIPNVASDVGASLSPMGFHTHSPQQPTSSSASKINIDPLPLPPLHQSSSTLVRTSIASQPPTHPSQHTPPRLSGKPFAAGSAMQATESQSVQDKRDSTGHPLTEAFPSPVTCTVSDTRSPVELSLQPATSDQIQSVEKLLAGGDSTGTEGRKSEPSTSDLTPDLSIIKVEGADTGGLHMYVDAPDDTKAMMQSHEGDVCESEDERDYGQGEGSNEGSNISGEQMGMWQGQDGSFQGPDGGFSGDGSFQSQDGSFQGLDEVFVFPPKSCPYCGFWSKYSTTLKRHIEGHDKRTRLKHSCPVCKKCFKRSDYIPKHIRLQHPTYHKK